MVEILVPITERAAYLSRIFYGSTIPLLVLCIPTLALRVSLKLRPFRLGLDDLFIIVGFILAMIDWALITNFMYLSARFITEEEVHNGAKFGFFAIFIWGLAMSFIKTAIALTFLRVHSGRLWSIFLYSIIALQMGYGMGNALFILLECRPMHAAWDLTMPRSYCLSYDTIRIVSNLGSYINIATDILLSLAPMAFLHKLRRPLREKILVCVLMSMGLFASIASIMKSLVVREWGLPNTDPWALAISINTWTSIEQLVATFAACAPYLKLPLQRFLGIFGVSLTQHLPLSYGQISMPNDGTNFLTNPVAQGLKGNGIAVNISHADLPLNGSINLSVPDAVHLAGGTGRRSDGSVRTVNAEVPLHTV